MDWYRLRHTIRLTTLSTGFKRANYIREKNIFKHTGRGCMFMFRKLPLYPELISVGNNVHIASNVTFITHDVVHNMLNAKYKEDFYKEYIGCIEIGDNVFVGANVTFLCNSKVPSDSIIGANSMVNRKLEKSGVYVGTPVKYLCSLEEFVEKRKRYNIVLEKSRGILSKDTIENCWKNYYEQ